MPAKSIFLTTKLLIAKKCKNEKYATAWNAKYVKIIKINIPANSMIFFIF